MKYFFYLSLLSLPLAAQGASLQNFTNASIYKNLALGEASAVTYNRDTNTLFTIGDEGHFMVQISKTGQFIDQMGFNNRGPRVPAGQRALDDPEGLAYLGNGKFMIADERHMTAWSTTYTTGIEIQPGTMQGSIFGEDAGNNGLEGIAYDPITNSLWGVREKNAMTIYQMSNITGGGPSVLSEPFASRAFNRAGILDIADIYMLANSAAFAENDPRRMNILILSQESNRILEMTRTGEIVDTLDLSFLGSDSIEGMTMDDEGNLYLVSETTKDGAGSTLFVLNAVPEPSTALLGGLGALCLLRRKRIK